MILTENTFDLAAKLREDSFVKIWPRLRCLDWLTTLRLQNTGLTNFKEVSLFEGIEALSSLTIFDISGNLERHLPASLSQLKYLKTLILKDNQFLILNIKSESLEELNVSGNILSEMCLHTPRLTSLDISRNTTFMLTKEFFKGLPHLTFLNMSHRYKEISNSFELLASLVEHDISLNCLSYLPKGLTKLSKLEKLNASRNNLTSVEGIETLSSLVHLDLSHTDIQTPPTLPTSCVYVNLSDTKIQDDPFPTTVTLIYTDTPLWSILHPFDYDDIYSDEVESDDDESSEYGSSDESGDDFS